MRLSLHTVAERRIYRQSGQEDVEGRGAFTRRIDRVYGYTQCA